MLKKYLVLLAILALSLPLMWFAHPIPTYAVAATDFGFDFRATLGFVTDPNYASFEGKSVFPHTYTNGLSQTISAGWVVGPSGSVNRSAANDPRLAGIAYVANNGATQIFNITLPFSGAWTITAAIGDQGGPQNQYVIFLDNVSAFATYTNVSTASNSFMDANGTVWTEANWVTSNTTLTHTFTSTAFAVQLGHVGSGSNNTTMAFLRVTQSLTATRRRAAVINQ